ncbi:ABC transporter substrate-binding protein [Acuticoccus sp. I52.16.1]|uniref:ABC transporter substrate-binding protein n=1 Tax=Acuticoccus sp. I52.16.1 TaxID=2928472 RepID=UPI001FD17003|nr:ABC transporter substrate-binding protein [Acuticoccus sp. I52.16.1]UOM34715.1 ABC transporter substrate-binding protein [Acuticoccus sp. I52.16.1]
MTHLRALLAAAGLAALSAATPALAATPDNMLVIANRIDDIVSLDPAETFEFAGNDVNRNVYGRLVNFDPADLEAGYQPDIAESWEVSEDGTSITFKIRDGMTFHSGNPVRAEDAAFSLRRVIKLNLTPSFIFSQFGFTPENVDEKITFDDTTVTLNFDAPYAESFVLNCLTAGVGSIVDKELAMEHESDGDFGHDWLKTNSAGSYAYKLTSWRPAEAVTLEANPDFYLGEPAMKRVIVRHISESANQRLLLERGDIDVARNLNPEDVAGIESAEGVKVVDELRGRIMYASFNQKNEFSANPKVIEALKYAVDYEGMANSFLKGQWTIHQTFLPQTYFGALDETPYTFDLDKAKALIVEAGVETPITLGLGVRDAQERIEIAQSMQNTLGELGIDLDITVGTGAQTLGKYRARELDVYVGEWGPDYPDPNTNAATFSSNPDNSDAAQATGILAWRNAYDPGALTQKTKDAVLEKDTETRRKMYEEIQQTFLETAPFVIMFQKIEQAAMRDNVEGLSLGQAITAAAYWKVSK